MNALAHPLAFWLIIGLTTAFLSGVAMVKLGVKEFLITTGIMLALVALAGAFVTALTWSILGRLW